MAVTYHFVIMEWYLLKSVVQTFLSCFPVPGIHTFSPYFFFLILLDVFIICLHDILFYICSFLAYAILSVQSKLYFKSIN